MRCMSLVSLVTARNLQHRTDTCSLHGLVTALLCWQVFRLSQMLRPCFAGKLSARHMASFSLSHHRLRRPFSLTHRPRLSLLLSALHSSHPLQSCTSYPHPVLLTNLSFQVDSAIFPHWHRVAPPR